MTQEGSLAAMQKEGVTAVPLPLLRLRDLSMAQMKQLMAGFFQHSEEILPALAGEGEGSSARQASFREALQELHLQREALTLSFQQWLARAFNDCARNAWTVTLPSEDEALSLLPHAGREEQLAIEGMISKLRHHYGEPVEMIRLRLQKLLRVDELAVSRNPLDPRVLCQGLAETCADLAMATHCRLAVYKLFDPLLVDQLGPLYSLANQLLIREGVMPDKRHQEVPAITSAGTSSVAFSSGKGTAKKEATGFSELSALLRESHEENGPWQSGSEQSGSEVMATEELVQLLSDVQEAPETLLAAGARSGSLKERVTQLLALRSCARSAPGPVDSDVINLVTMLFDFILRDRQLPGPMKALLGQLQIPLLKVALLDRSFFRHGGHPARQLLNAMATAALSWNPPGAGAADPLGDCLTELVARINRDFTDDVTLFERWLTEFSDFNDRHQRRDQLLQRRLLDAEEGRARHAQAQEAVNVLLGQLDDKHVLPESVTRLLEDPWRRVLQWYWLQWGEDSAQWQEISRLTGLLIWSVDPRPVVRTTRNDLLRRIPEIVDGVRRGLNAIAWDPFTIDEWVRELELLHVATLQQLKSFAGPGQNAAPGVASAESDQAPDQAPPADGQEMPHPAWLERARAMSVGSWVEWHSSDTRRIRCKLAAVIKASGRYIFVNRSGAKVMEYSEPDVARALADGVISPLDDTQIFDRALASVIDSLRHSRR